MDQVDYDAPEHSSAIAEILTFLAWPHKRCKLLGKSRQALITLGLAPGPVYEAAIAHLSAKLSLYLQIQTMYDAESVIGYVICPLFVEGHRLFCKLFMSTDPSDNSKALMISAHPPERPCPGEKK
jgi:hypothetical protein